MDTHEWGVNPVVKAEIPCAARQRAGSRKNWTPADDRVVRAGSKGAQSLLPIVLAHRSSAHPLSGAPDLCQ